MTSRGRQHFLLVDYLPDPLACRITGLSPLEVHQLGTDEPQFIQAAVAHLGYKGTCSVGYNSIRFDDEVTRHTLFRNFRDPYRHEWHNGNSRWDLLDVVRLTRALRPDGIQWPFNDDGVPNNRLENITACNGLAHENAHDALSDVYATIDVAKLVRSAQPRLYDYALSLRDKRSVAALLNWQSAQPVIHVSGMVSSDYLHTSIVVPLMRHPSNQNAVIVLDLRTDPDALRGLDANAIRERLYTANIDANERLNLRSVHINRCPMIAPLATLREEDAERIGIDRNGSIQRASKIPAVMNPELTNAISQAFTYQPNEHSEKLDLAIQRCPEASLYSGGFLNENDRRRAEVIAETAPRELKNFTAEHGFFDDRRLQTLMMNYRARHALATLTTNEREEWFADCADRLGSEEDVPWRTVQAFDLTMHTTQWRDDEHGLRADLNAWRERVESYLTEDMESAE